MNIVCEKNEKTVKLIIEGRIDTTTSPELEEQVKSVIKDADELYLDFSDVVYISSAGLRVLLSAQKIANSSDKKMVILSPTDEVKEVFEITGFKDILTIE